MLGGLFLMPIGGGSPRPGADVGRVWLGVRAPVYALGDLCCHVADGGRDRRAPCVCLWRFPGTGLSAEKASAICVVVRRLCR